MSADHRVVDAATLCSQLMPSSASAYPDLVLVPRSCLDPCAHAYKDSSVFGEPEYNGHAKAASVGSRPSGVTGPACDSQRALRGIFG